MSERRLELKIGLLVLMALGGIVALFFMTGELRLGGTTPLAVDFAHSGNVVAGAPVRLAGIAVGKVSEVSLLPERRDPAGRPLPVRVELDVDRALFTQLTADLEVTVATQGPLGEPYIELAQGSATAPKLAPGQSVRGTDPMRLEILLQRMGALLEAFEGRGDGSRELVDAIASIGRLAARLDTLLANASADAGATRELVATLADTVKDVRAVASAVRRTLEPGGDAARLMSDGAALAKLLNSRAPAMTDDAATTLDALAKVAGPLDATDGARVKQALEKVSAATESLERLASRGDRLLARIDAGEGTLGALQKDTALYEELKALITDLRKHPWKVLWKD